MSRILIATHPKDIHALEVSAVLEERGHDVALWYGSDFPTQQQASLELTPPANPGEQQQLACQVDWHVHGLDLDIRPPFDTIWLRRLTSPVVPADELHPGDLPVARMECADFAGSLYHLATPDAFWVNPLVGRVRSDTKAVQLREACAVGLRIPPTLMSNDPERIRRFLDAHAAAGTIYKPFNPIHWEMEDEGAAILFTNRVTADDLPDDDLLRLTPGIFQALVPKSHELRVTVMGHHCVTVRMASQALDDARLDWRAGSARLHMEPTELDAGVRAQCLELMRRLGIVFGCFDFIVTPEGEHVFLEVNPMGQFLWVEQSAPDARVLAPFADFLASGDPEFEWTPSPETDHITHERYAQLGQERIDATDERHVMPTPSHASTDLVSEEDEAEDLRA